ncbi:DUF4019 domain-containing protein [Arenimonas sp.]|uniref:DUF4019 domain-containing protein n=1 Tax=Arenimonas sp. TaxID=1872635 RepID=UPI0039E32B4B
MQLPSLVAGRGSLFPGIGMKRLLAAFVILSILGACSVSFSPGGETGLPEPTPGTPAQQQEAVTAAREYIDMIDRGQYSRTWERAGPALKDLTNELVWTNTLKLASKLSEGKPEREIQGLGFATQVDVGGPIGEYAFVVFASRSGGMSLSEKVVMQKAGGDWLIVGYFANKQTTFGTKKG